jgi:hypothetical protein
MMVDADKPKVLTNKRGYEADSQLGDDRVNIIFDLRATKGNRVAGPQHLNACQQ